MRIRRDLKCCGGCNCSACCDTCSLSVTVEAPPGDLVGSVQQTQSFCGSQFDVKDEKGDTVLVIKGPPCVLCPDLCDVEFKVSKVFIFWLQLLKRSHSLDSIRRRSSQGGFDTETVFGAASGNVHEGRQLRYQFPHGFGSESESHSARRRLFDR